MPQLIPNTPFTSGSVFSPEAANAIANPFFDDQTQYLGHLAKIKDSDLDDSVVSIKTRVANNELNLKVTAGSGLNAIYASGRALYGTRLFTINSSSVALIASAINYIYVDVEGVVKGTTGFPPIVRALLAMVITNTTGVLLVHDAREGYKVEVIKPLATTVKNFGGRGDAGAFIAAGGEVLSDGEYYFTTFTVPAGKSITIDKLAKIYCTGDADISGTVNVSPATLGGSRTIVAGNNVLFPGIPGQGFGSAPGENPSSPYTHHISAVGSGGTAGNVILAGTYQNVISKAGGSGGGCFWLEAAGTISVTGVIIANGTAGEDSGYSGSATNGNATGAGGGGSGGLILFKSLINIVISGTLSVNGGKGGNGGDNGTGCGAEGGCGGGGGRIVIFSPAVNTTGSVFNLAGGAGGTGNNTTATLIANNTNGGSFGGLGGTASSSNGQPGGIGVTTIKTFTPLG